MKHLPLLTVLALLATGLATAPAPAAAAPAAVSPVSTVGAASAMGPVGAEERKTVRLDGVTVRLRKRTRQVVTVNRTTGHHARVTLWMREDGKWVRRFRATDGRIGYNGLVAPTKRVQGSGKTPLGTHSLPWAFGMRKERPNWDSSYRRVRKGDFWVLDNRSKHYNRYRHRSQGGFRWRLPASHPNGSERLKDYPKQYEFSFVTSFNVRQVRHRGGAIFLHVNGSGATAGCVSAPRWFLRKLMPRLDQSKVPLIAIGR